MTRTDLENNNTEPAADEEEPESATTNHTLASKAPDSANRTSVCSNASSRPPSLELGEFQVILAESVFQMTKYRNADLVFEERSIVALSVRQRRNDSDLHESCCLGRCCRHCCCSLCPNP